MMTENGEVRVAIYTDTYHPAIDGVVNYVDGIASYFRKQGVMSIIATVGNGRTSLEYNGKSAVIKGRGLTFLPYPQYSICIAPFRVNRIVKRLKPEVVHTQTPFVLGYMGLRLARKLGIRVFSTFHSLVLDETVVSSYSGIVGKRSDFIIKELKRYLRWYYSKCEKVICPSEFVRRKLNDIGVKNTIVIQNGLDLEKMNGRIPKEEARSLLGIHSDDKVILFLGRISREKDLEVLIDSASLPEMRDCRFIIAGSGPHLEYYRNYARSNNVNNLKFTGFVTSEQKDLLFRACDIFCNPSDYEVLSTVDIEALYMQRPILVPEESSQVELVTPGLNGEIFRKNDPVDLAAKITMMLNIQKSYIPDHGIEKFSLENHFARLMDLYKG